MLLCGQACHGDRDWRDWSDLCHGLVSQVNFWIHGFVISVAYFKMKMRAPRVSSPTHLSNKVSLMDLVMPLGDQFACMGIKGHKLTVINHDGIPIPMLPSGKNNLTIP